MDDMTCIAQKSFEICPRCRLRGKRNAPGILLPRAIRLPFNDSRMHDSFLASVEAAMSALELA
jgi:hypothetical protein